MSQDSPWMTKKGKFLAFEATKTRELVNTAAIFKQAFHVQSGTGGTIDCPHKHYINLK